MSHLECPSCKLRIIAIGAPRSCPRCRIHRKATVDLLAVVVSPLATAKSESAIEEKHEGLSAG
jgi:hypothetical protein